MADEQEAHDELGRSTFQIQDKPVSDDSRQENRQLNFLSELLCFSRRDHGDYINFDERAN